MTGRLRQGKAGHLLILCLASAAGCHQSRSPDFRAIKSRANQAQSELSTQNSASQAGASAATPQDASVLSSSAAARESSNDASLGVTVLNQDAEMSCTWVQSRAVAEVSESITPAQAEAMAVSEARRRAMQKLLGVKIRSRDLVFQQQGLRGRDDLIQSLVQTMRQGRIIDEKILSGGYQAGSRCPFCRYQATVKDCIKPLPEESEKNFRVRVDLSKQHLTDGESGRIEISASTSCFVYIYDQGMDGSMSMIVPNDYVPSLKAGPDKTVIYPDPRDARQDGLELLAQIPAGQTVSAETISAIASREPLPEAIYGLKKGDDYFSLLKRLNASSYDWTDDAEPYFIYAR